LDKFPPVLILAGGLGTRLSALNPNLPKSMVDVNGQPFIAHQLQLLRKQGVDDVVLCVGHQEKPLRDFVGDGTIFGIRVRYSTDYSPENSNQLLGTGGAVLKASKLVSSPFAVLYGDSYLDVAFAPFFESFVRLGKPALMTVYRNNNRRVPSNLLVRRGQVIAYEKEKPTPDMKHIDYGLTIFSEAALAGSPQSQPFDLALVIKSLIGRGQLACHQVDVCFREVGSEEGLRELEEYLQVQKNQTDDAKAEVTFET